LVPKPYYQWNNRETIDQLCKPKAKGGAGLVLEDANINNTTLVRIVSAIDEKRKEKKTEEECIKHATKVMTSFGVTESTSKAVVEWVASNLTEPFLKIELYRPITSIVSDFKTSLKLWDINMRATEDKQRSLLKNYFKTPLYPNHIQNFKSNGWDLHSSCLDPFSIPEDKGKELRKAIDEAPVVGRDVSNRTILSLIDLSGAGKLV